VIVECDHDRPRALTLGGRRVEVESVLDTWLVEDEWWRTRLERRYVRLVLADGRLLTLFEDRAAGSWYVQGYRLPVGV
jgi:hypothetical protein